MRPKILIAVPVYGGVDPFFVQSLVTAIIEHQARRPAPYEIAFRMNLGDSLVPRARNTLAGEFLKSGSTHLLFLDSDLIWGLDMIDALLARDLPIVGGLYPKKQAKLDWVCNIIEGEEEDGTGLLRVKYTGTGCMLIRREVLEEMMRAFPEIAFDADAGSVPGHDFFSVGRYRFPSGASRYLSEDWYFCQRAIDLGFPVHVDCRVVLKHVGQMIYPIEDPFTKEPEPLPSNFDDMARAQAGC